MQENTAWRLSASVSHVLLGRFKLAQCWFCLPFIDCPLRVKVLQTNVAPKIWSQIRGTSPKTLVLCIHSNGKTEFSENLFCIKRNIKQYINKGLPTTFWDGRGGSISGSSIVVEHNSVFLLKDEVNTVVLWWVLTYGGVTFVEVSGCFFVLGRTIYFKLPQV